LRLKRTNERTLEKKQLEDLFVAETIPKSKQSYYYIIPKDWCLEWKETVENVEIEDMEDKIDNSQFLCAHNCLNHDPLLQFNASPAQSAAYDKFRFVCEASWKYLEKKYGAGPPLRCKVHRDNDSFTIDCDPSICSTCQPEQQKVDLQRLSEFENGDIYLILNEKEQSKEEDFTVVSKKKKGRGKFTEISSNSTTSNGNSASRYSLRSKDVTKKEKIEGLKHSDSLQHLKLRIYEKMDIPPFQQALFLEEKPLENDQLTLSHYKIYPGVTLVLEKKEEDVEILDDIPSNYYEEGFKGTGLYSNNFEKGNNSPKKESNGAEKQCPVCTLFNPSGAPKCDACDTPF